jgi:hypothetical protein
VQETQTEEVADTSVNPQDKTPESFDQHTQTQEEEESKQEEVPALEIIL